MIAVNINDIGDSKKRMNDLYYEYTDQEGIKIGSWRSNGCYFRAVGG